MLDQWLIQFTRLFTLKNILIKKILITHYKYPKILFIYQAQQI